jgi:ketopantoate hydroxymethyltransferase
MRIVDCHVHLNGEAAAADVLKALDANSIALFAELGLTPAQQERILSGTAEDLFPAKR